MRITFRKRPNERGLARHVQGPRGYEVRLDGKTIAAVSPLPVGFHEYRGWYWYCGQRTDLGIEYRNTCRSPVDTADEAKAQCKAYLLACLKGRKP
jgi:hypothetical protein